MDNAIPPIVTPGLGGRPADSGVSAGVENPPSELQNVGLGENVDLEIMQKPDVNDLNKIQSSVKLQIGNKLLEIPLSLQINKDLDLSPDQPYAVLAKIISKGPQNFELKFLNINNEKPENFVLNTSPEVYERDLPSKPSDNSFLSRLTSVLKLHPSSLPKVSGQQHYQFDPAKISNIAEDKNFKLSDVKLLPIKLAPVIEQALTAKNISATLAKQVSQLFADVRVDLQIAPALRQIQSENIPIEKSVPDLLQKIVDLVSSASSLPNTKPLSDPALHSVFEKILAQLSKLPGLNVQGGLKIISGQNWPLIQTPLGDVIPEVALKIPQDTKLLLQIKQLWVKSDSKPGIALDKFSHTQLQEVFEMLDKKGLSQIQNQLLSKVPQNNEKMLSNIISFIKASQQQKIEHWLGKDMVEMLQKSGREGSEVLEKVGNMLQNQTQENPNWRIIDVPFYGDNIFNRIRVAVKKMQDEENQKNKEIKGKSAVRFIVDTDFTKLGRFQLDGFSFIKDKRFDLIIRTELDLGNDFCANLMGIFQKSLAEVDYTGNIKVNVKENFIKICEDDKKDTTLENGIFI